MKELRFDAAGAAVGTGTGAEVTAGAGIAEVTGTDVGVGAAVGAIRPLNSDPGASGGACPNKSITFVVAGAGAAVGAGEATGDAPKGLALPI
jgi:hypothetical protein